MMKTYIVFIIEKYHCESWFIIVKIFANQRFSSLFVNFIAYLLFDQK